MTREDLLKMKLHEERIVSHEGFQETAVKVSVRRVVGGWIYTTSTIQTDSMCFVPEN